MTLFVYILVSAIVSIAVRFTLSVSFQGVTHAPLIGYATFIIMLAALIARNNKDVFSGGKAIVLAPAAFILLSIVIIILGGIIYESNHLIGAIMMKLALLGYYPYGPDALFEYGITLWALSVLVAMAAAISIGGLGRNLRSRLGSNPGSGDTSSGDTFRGHNT